jgi:hypothetical protein
MVWSKSVFVANSTALAFQALDTPETGHIVHSTACLANKTRKVGDADSWR